MTPALGPAAYALEAQMARFERSASRVATQSQPDYVQETVEQMSADAGAQANMATIRTADQMVGTLFDILA
jgi:flagellar hook protein FlgE